MPDRDEQDFLRLARARLDSAKAAERAQRPTYAADLKTFSGIYQTERQRQHALVVTIKARLRSRGVVWPGM